MKRSAVRCRCGHQVLAKEVLRTDLYERPSGREYVYVKYRCKRCKRVGETFVAENRWDWRIFEAPQTEMSESELDAFAEQTPISSEDLLNFHRLLEKVSTTTDLVATDLSVTGEKVSLESTGEIAIQPTGALEETPGSGVQTTEERIPDSKNEASVKHARIEPKRGDFKSGNDGLNSNPDPDAKKESKKDAGKTSGPEDGPAR